MNKCLNTFDLDDLKNLIDSNLAFRDFIATEVYERQCDLVVSEFMKDFPARYEFSCVYATQVHFDNRYGYGVKWDEIIKWIGRVEHDFCLLDNIDVKQGSMELAKQAEELQEKLDYFDLSDLDYTRIEKKVDEIQKELETRVKNAIDLYLDATDDPDYLKEEIEFLDYLLNDLYMDDNGIIFQDIHTIKYL